MKNYLLLLLLMLFSYTLSAQKARLEQILKDMNQEIQAQKSMDSLLIVWKEPFKMPQLPKELNGTKLYTFDLLGWHHYLRRHKSKNRTSFFGGDLDISGDSARLYLNGVEANYKDFNVHYLKKKKHRKSYFILSWKDDMASGLRIGIGDAKNLSDYGLVEIRRDSLLSIKTFWYSVCFKSSHLFNMANHRTLNPYEWKQSFKQYINKEKKKGRLIIKKKFWEYLNEYTSPLQKEDMFPMGIAWLNEIHLGENEWYIEYFVGYVYSREQKTVELNTPYRIHLHFK